MIRYFLIVLSVFLVGNVSADKDVSTLQSIGERYFSIYSKRDNVDELMVLYAENAELKDLVYGNHVVGKDNIKKFFNWGGKNFKLVNKSEFIKIDNQYYDNNTIITEGYFYPFHYYGESLGPWYFLTVLKLDANQKIVEHIDWINYTPKEKFTDGKNLNQLINIDG